MILQLSHYALIIATIASLAITFCQKTTKITNSSLNTHTLVNLVFLLVSISFCGLLYTHINLDFSVLNTVKHSHSTQPMLYIICSIWGNHEGSMLLWCFILTFYSFILNLISLENKEKFLSILSSFIAFFLVFTLLTSNPFLQTTYRYLEGKELNPILQDFILAIHPPFIYLGYLGLSICFILQLTKLADTKEVSLLWIKKFALISWIFLTVGIALGSWWAYYELGWGGWWFWDPVENASLLPWIVATALVHSIQYSWIKRLAFLGFFSSVLGTFFVRSGLIESVHSFASDRHKGIFIAIFLMYLLILHFYYSGSSNASQSSPTKPFSLKGLILLNHFFFLAYYVIIILGTFYPVIYSILFNKSITIEPSFYNELIIIVTLPLIVIMNLRENISKKQCFHLGVILLCIMLITELYFNSISWTTNAYLIVSFWSIYLLFYNYKNYLSIKFAHLGFILLSISIAGWYALKHEIHKVLYPGDIIMIDDYNIIFRGINSIIGPNYNSLFANYLITHKNTIIGVMFPEKRHYLVQDLYTTKVDIESNLLLDYQIIIGDGNIYSGWSTSIYYYPLISGLWCSTMLLVLGASIALYKNKNKIYNKNIFI
jgi:cytochrome c-type biogenesis protein CcmF